MFRTNPLALLVLISMPFAVSAESYCPPVSSEDIVAATSTEGATLETAECSARLRQFIAETMATVRTSYGAFLDDAAADPKTADELTLLIARQDLLATNWISLTTSISHSQSPSVARLLQETTAQLSAALTPDDFASFERYKQSLPTRELLKPLTSRLESAGVPLGKEQLERAVRDVHAWSAGLVDRVREDGGEDILYCEQADAFSNRRDEQLLAIVARSLDEKQTAVARDYFRERAQEREKVTAVRRARAGDGPCTIRDINVRRPGV